MKNTIIVVLVLIVVGCAQKEESINNMDVQNPILNKANLGDTTLIVLNHIKFDKKEEFNKILLEEVMPASYDYKDTIQEKNQLNKLAIESMRILNPLKMNDDSTWTFVFFADPYYEGALYNIGPPLVQKYGEDSANAIFQRWSNCFAENQIVFFETQQ